MLFPDLCVLVPRVSWGSWRWRCREIDVPLCEVEMQGQGTTSLVAVEELIEARHRPATEKLQ